MVDFKKLMSTTPEEREASRKQLELKQENVRQEQQSMISDCLTRDKKLTAWELDFVNSIATQFDAGKFLSDKQEDILERIWNKVTK